MAGIDFAEGVRKAFLAGVGAVATGAEMSRDLIDELVKKGELTIEQGKQLNAELTRKAKEAVSTGEDAALKAKLKGMTSEERAAWVEKARKMAEDLEATPAEDVEVEVSDETDETDE